MKADDIDTGKGNELSISASLHGTSSFDWTGTVQI